MGLLQDLKSVLKREATQAKRWIDKSVGDANMALGDAEKRAAAAPDERLQYTLDDIEANEQSFEEVKARAEAATARANADAEVAESEVVDSEVVDSEVVEVQGHKTKDDDPDPPAVTDSPPPNG